MFANNYPRFDRARFVDATEGRWTAAERRAGAPAAVPADEGGE
jgi:hypothetical protein